jgi:hypothetical protein
VWSWTVLDDDVDDHDDHDDEEEACGCLKPQSGLFLNILLVYIVRSP